MHTFDGEISSKAVRRPRREISTTTSVVRKEVSVTGSG